VAASSCNGKLYVGYVVCGMGKVQLWLFVVRNSVPLQIWTGPEGSRRLRLPDFKTFGT